MEGTCIDAIVRRRGSQAGEA